MGMTNKQYQGFIRALKELAHKTIEQGLEEKRSKEEVLEDVRKIETLLQDMLEDGN